MGEQNKWIPVQAQIFIDNALTIANKSDLNDCSSITAKTSQKAVRKS